MKTTRENKTRQERILTGEVLLNNIHLEDGLFKEQRLCCANHAEEEIFLDKIGWKNFICPKCGCDYSIGRKIVILE
jgi:hypothetical protein